MSFVGTRPEVTKYVKKYTKEIHYTKIRKVHQLEDWMEKWQLKHRMKWDWS